MGMYEVQRSLLQQQQRSSDGASSSLYKCTHKRNARCNETCITIACMCPGLFVPVLLQSTASLMFSTLHLPPDIAAIHADPLLWVCHQVEAFSSPYHLGTSHQARVHRTAAPSVTISSAARLYFISFVVVMYHVLSMRLHFDFNQTQSPKL